MEASFLEAAINILEKSIPTTSGTTRASSKEDRPTAQPRSRARRARIFFRPASVRRTLAQAAGKLQIPKGGRLPLGKVLLNATLKVAPDSVEARNTIPQIRSAVKEIEKDILVGGGTAVQYDIDVASRHDNRLIIPIVLVS